jgi:hypothetical protein
MNPELLDILAGRHCCHCASDTFPRDLASIRMNAFAIEGSVTWEVWMHKHFWNEVALGNLGLNSMKLFKGMVN